MVRIVKVPEHRVEDSETDGLGVAAALSVTSGFDAVHAQAAGPVDVVDLFSGCGGLSAGFDYVGRMTPSFRLAAAVDADVHSAATYGANLPVTPLVEDLSKASRSARAAKRLRERCSLRPDAPLVLLGGPPCQGFSAHRKKDGVGLSDARDELVEAFARIAAAWEPDLIVIENVPELLANKNWHLFESLRRTLGRRGYQVRAQIHNLAGFGVPQVRFRALIVASREEFRMPRPFLPHSEFRTVRDAIHALPRVEAGEPCQVDPMHVSTRHRQSTIETIRMVSRDGGNRPKGVGPRCLDRVDGYRDVYGRMYWDRPANTITAYSRNPASGRYIHPSADRGLTVREAALLQSFPRRYKFCGPFDHRFLQIGNAVPPAFAAYLAAHIWSHLRSPPVVPDDRSLDVESPVSNSFSSGIAGRKRGS